MEKKLRQVTDTIHGTIFLSSLESELISTPYFYRLHDIYQSSTVYMTFPSNRTKRYEHSLGTMELASSMLFSAVSNADHQTRTMLFRKLKGYFEEIFDLAIFQSEVQVAPYFTKNRDIINSLFNKIDLEEENSIVLNNIVNNEIREAVTEGCFSDSALDYYQFYPMGVDEDSNYNDVENLFLYRCLLQAVRIVALFHDVGHPPYSHIIENVLEDLYKKCTSNDNGGWNKSKLKVFKKCMDPYITEDERKAYKCQTLYSKSSLIDAATHERIGLSLLQSAINDVIPEIISRIVNSSRKDCCKISSVLYYILVVEFAVAILVEKDIFFKSFHKIVDGVLDSDRLDYITRDSLNSGVDWGTIPYKRVINSAKLVYLTHYEDEKLSEEERPFVIAYPKKVSDDIVDMLLVRYKIFARINFHHRCMKTSVALQSAVLELAENYLMSADDAQCINPEISTLWTALGMSIGDRKKRVIQWNDSWLISALHKALVNLNVKNTNNHLKENLEEILLNKKRYYSLLKRGSDSQKFVQKVFTYSEITKKDIEKLKCREYAKYYIHLEQEVADAEILDTPKTDAIDSIQRVKEFDEILRTGDLELLCRVMPLERKSVYETITDVLNRLKAEGAIADYKIIVNKGRKKYGVPLHKDVLDEIYLYSDNKYSIFEEEKMLKPQILTLEQSVPWIYAYFVPNKEQDELNDVAEKIYDEMAKEVGSQLRARYEELFGKKIE